MLSKLNFIKIFLTISSVLMIFFWIFVIGNVVYALDSNCDGVDDDGDGQCDEDFIVNTVCDGPDTDSCKEGFFQCPKMCGSAGVYCDDDTNSTTQDCYACNTDGDCDGSFEQTDSDCASVYYCSEYGNEHSDGYTGSCLASASNQYGSSCSGSTLISLKSDSGICTCAPQVCIATKNEVCTNGCVGSWPDAYCAGAGGSNLLPSSRLTADPTPSQPLSGDEIIATSNTTKSLTINKGQTIAFEGLAWDCDGDQDIAQKYPKDNLGSSSILTNGNPLGSCASNIDYFSFPRTNQTFDSAGVLNRYILIQDKQGNSSQSQITITVTDIPNNPPYIPKKASFGSPAGQAPQASGVQEDDKNTIALQWNETRISNQRDPDGDNDFDHYEIWYTASNPINWRIYDRDGNCKSPVYGTSCSFKLSSSGKGTQYQWNVIAVDKKGAKSHNPECNQIANCQCDTNTGVCTIK